MAQVSLITVNLQNMNLEIAKNLDIKMEDVPINILLPISLAANVCGVDIAALGGGAIGSDKNTCTATNTTLATQYVSNLIGTSADPATTDASTAATGAAPAAPTDTGAPAPGTGATPPSDTTAPTTEGGTTPSGAETAPDTSATSEPAPAQ